MSQNCFTWLLRQLVEATIGPEGWIRNCVSPLWDGGDVASQVCYMYNYMYMWGISFHWQLLLISPCHLLESVCGIRNRVSPLSGSGNAAGSAAVHQKLGRTTEAGLLESRTIWTYKDLRICGRKDLHKSCEMSNGWKLSTVKSSDL